MAFLDFLGNYVSDPTYNVPRQGITGADITSGAKSVGDVTGTNAATVSHPGITYADIAKALLSMSNSPTGHAFGQAIGQRYGSQAGMPNEQLLHQQQQKKGGSGNLLLNVFSSYLGV